MTVLDFYKSFDFLQFSTMHVYSYLVALERILYALVSGILLSIRIDDLDSLRYRSNR